MLLSYSAKWQQSHLSQMATIAARICKLFPMTFHLKNSLKFSQKGRQAPKTTNGRVQWNGWNDPPTDRPTARPSVMEHFGRPLINPGQIWRHCSSWRRSSISSINQEKFSRMQFDSVIEFNRCQSACVCVYLQISKNNGFLIGQRMS